jgi:hypothetical protein
MCRVFQDSLGNPFGALQGAPAIVEITMLTLTMVVLGLLTFAAMIGFIALCDHV